MDCLSLIISKQHSPLLIWMESLLISMVHELESLTHKVREKLPEVLPYTASVPHQYCHLRCFLWPSEVPRNRLPVVVCQLVGTGMVPWYLIRAQEWSYDYCYHCLDYSDYCNGYSNYCFWIIGLLRLLFLDYSDYSHYCDFCDYWEPIQTLHQFNPEKSVFDAAFFCRRSWKKEGSSVFSPYQRP